MCATEEWLAVDPLILRSRSNWPARPGFPAPYMSLSSYRGLHTYLLECLNPQLHLMQRKSHIHFGLEVSCRFPLILFTGRLLKGVAATIAASITQWVFFFYNSNTLTSKFVCESPLDLTKVRLQASGDKRMIESIRKTVKTAGANSDCVAIHSCSLINSVQVLGDYSMEYRVLGCVRCRIRCVGSGRMMRARGC